MDSELSKTVSTAFSRPLVNFLSHKTYPLKMNFHWILWCRQNEWIYNWFIWDMFYVLKEELFPRIFSKSALLLNISIWAISASFKDFSLIFGANESWRFILSNAKVFYPLLVFYPPHTSFLPTYYLKCWNLTFYVRHSYEKGGVKHCESG